MSLRTVHVKYVLLIIREETCLFVCFGAAVLFFARIELGMANLMNFLSTVSFIAFDFFWVVCSLRAALVYVCCQGVLLHIL